MSEAVDPALWAPVDPEGTTWAELLSVAPTIIHTWLSVRFPLGAASAFGPSFRDEPMHFLLMPATSIELPGAADQVSAAAKAYLAQHPRHTLTFLGNTARETELMQAAGHVAETINQNCLLNDQAFRVLPGVEPSYDAVYNSRLSPEKRVDLARGIESLALIYFYAAFEGPPSHFHAEHARYRAMMPTAKFVNELTPDGCKFFLPREVNAALATARVGLCLSPVEGAMRAAVEYLFAGLSVVSTPSLGGRDYFFDDEFCLIADPDPRSIREAVDALVARGVPKAYVRAKTLARVERERGRYIQLVQNMIDRDRGSALFAERFWECAHGGELVRWRPMPEFAGIVRSHIDADRESRADKPGGRPVTGAPLPQPSDPALSTPAVSVVLPTYNRASFLPKAIRSVRSQTFESWELIVVDDGSTDGTEDVLAPFLRDPRIRRVRSEGPRGPAGARNAGIRAARAEAVAFLDSDDVWFPTKLERFLREFRKSEDIVLVGSDYLMVDPSARKRESMKAFLFDTMVRWWERYPVAREAIPVPRLRQDIQTIVSPDVMLSMTIGGFLWVHTSSAMVRRDAAIRAGLFDPALRRTEDIDLWLKLSRLGRVAYIDEALAAYDVSDRDQFAGRRYDSHAADRLETAYSEALHHLRLLGRIARAHALSPQQKRLLGRRRIAHHRRCGTIAWKEGRKAAAALHAGPVIVGKAARSLRRWRRRSVSVDRNAAK